ncbi:NAD(P)H-binding protein [Pseudomonas sp. TH31]|uniref:NAD(P)H-binding protein n=1 Tax=Pseudomonas sp. TH31 TaxID=2796396 RepID=UPI0019130A65|nr:NAD(P)H-binding protein [Pseudomonas sp. TH31]MBK5417484.1 NAD(P)H-binding protein [Pseudomonas sp. TH31]
MKALIFGATGMVGQGVLRESLLAADVEQVVVVGRTPVETTDPKLQSLVVPDLTRPSAVEGQLQGFDACFFCLGVSSSGMDETQYSRLTYDLTLAVAEVLARLNPNMTFVYVSGAGTDSSEKGKSMWARVKGRTENALLRLPFKAVYLFRPGVIQPLNGAVSKTSAYRWTYIVMGPLLPLLRRLFPRHVLTTVSVGRAMLGVARHGAAIAVLEAPDIQAAALRG